jgi:5'-nucleotidase
VAAWLVVAAAAAQGPVADLPLSTQDAKIGEVSFGDLAADALCDVSRAPVALMPAVSFKDGTISAGPLDKPGVAALLQQPDETWALVVLSGRQLRAALERSVSRAPLPNGAFLQVAGVTINYDPAGTRDLRIKSVLVSGAPLNETASYEVAMPLSLAKGGSGYFQIFDASAITRQGNDQMADVIFNFAKTRGHVNYTGQGRVVASH